MLLGNSGEVTLVVKHAMSVKKRQRWVNIPIYLRTPSLTPGSVKTASQLQNTYKGERTAAREETNIKYSPLDFEVIRLPFSSDTLLLQGHSSNLNFGPTLPQDFCVPVGLLAQAAEETPHPCDWDLKIWLFPSRFWAKIPNTMLCLCYAIVANSWTERTCILELPDIFQIKILPNQILLWTKSEFEQRNSFAVALLQFYCRPYNI